MQKEAFILDSVRTPRGKGSMKGALAEVPPVRLVKTLLDALKERNRLDPAVAEDLMLGCVTQIMEQGANLAKTAAQYSGFGSHMTGVTINRFCASGLEAVNQGACKVMSGMSDVVIAGGVESMSRIKMGSDGGALYMDPSIALPGYFVPQGISADLIATKYGYSRQDVDAIAVESQRRAAKAIKEGKFDRSIVPVRDQNGLSLLTHDENIRPDTTLEVLATLEPSFRLIGEMGGFDAVALDRYPEVEQLHYVHHAGNSSAIVDGAALMLIGNQRAAEKLGLRPRARIKAFAVVGADPTIMLTAPAPATRRALEKAGMTLDDIELFEVNEAFSAVVLRFLEETGVSMDRVNVNGGAIAMGHPLGATGCIILGTLLDELEARDAGTGLATLCVAGGMGIATIIERI